MPEPEEPRPDLPDVTLTITADTSSFENGVKDAHITTLRVALAMAEQRAEQAEAAVQRVREEHQSTTGRMNRCRVCRTTWPCRTYRSTEDRADLDPKDTP